MARTMTWGRSLEEGAQAGEVKGRREGHVKYRNYAGGASLALTEKLLIG